MCILSLFIFVLEKIAKSFEFCYKYHLNNFYILAIFVFIVRSCYFFDFSNPSSAAVTTSGSNSSGGTLEQMKAGISNFSNLFPEMSVPVSREVEDEANSYFQRIYNHQVISRNFHLIYMKFLRNSIFFFTGNHDHR